MSPDEPEKTQAELELEQRYLLGQIFRTRVPQTHAPEPQEQAAEPNREEPEPGPAAAPTVGQAPSMAEAVPAMPEAVPAMPEAAVAPAPSTPASAIASSPSAPAAPGSTLASPAPSARSGSNILYLGALAFVAVTIIGAVFGAGLVLLTQHPISGADRSTAAPAAPALSASPQLPAAPQRPVVPVIKAAAAVGTSPPATTQQAGTSPGQAQHPTSHQSTAIASAPVPAPSPLPDRAGAQSAISAATHDTGVSKSAAEAPAAPPPRVGRPLSTAEVLALLARGDALFHHADFPAARQLYQQAFDSGAGRGALGLGATYDPSFLDRDGRHGLRGDPAIAGFWYRSALALGEAEAKGRLAALDAAPPR